MTTAAQYENGPRKFQIHHESPTFGPFLPTLESGINEAPGKFGKKNKRSPIYTLYLYYLNRLYEVRNKAVAPGKKSKNC